MEDLETLVYGFVDDVYVVIHRSDRVDERDWQSCIDAALYASQVSRLLLVAGDLMPDVGQRHDLGRLHEKHATKVAMLSDASATRRVVTALKWSGIEAEGFRIDDLDGVLAFFSRPILRARLSSALGPYLDRSWLHEVVAPRAATDRSRNTSLHRSSLT
jgi:hypothetical protein